MEPAGPDRSAKPPHGRHANTTGTGVVAVDARIVLDGGRPDSGGLTCAETAFCCGGKFTRDIDVRQGIARTRRHVAPARSLC